MNPLKSFLGATFSHSSAPAGLELWPTGLFSGSDILDRGGSRRDEKARARLCN